ncbi:MAG TPA: hypothetical protein VG796_31475 [Verrucomicrobiales bacterium]|jgi:hypothetical protein|nr:hypothetical protein [Verrucomicrobiales bacterium]
MMIAANVYPAESTEMEATMSWPGFMALSLIVLLLSGIAIAVPFFRHSRKMIATDLLNK